MDLMGAMTKMHRISWKRETAGVLSVLESVAHSSENIPANTRIEILRYVNRALERYDWVRDEYGFYSEAPRKRVTRRKEVSGKERGSL